MPDFTASVYQNEYLAEGGTDVHAVVSVACSGAGSAGQTEGVEAAEIIIVDTSGSMDMPPAKIAAARRAAKVAVGEILDSTWFAVVSGNTQAQMVYPLRPGMAKMDAQHRQEALAAIDGLRSRGATAIGSWINATSELFSSVPSSQRHAILLTDGKIEGESPDALPAALRAAAGVFQCDCRGIGDDWVVEELRSIASALLGTVDIVADPEDLEADFEAMMRTAMSRGVADATLRVWAPQGSELLFVRQVAPTVEDLTPKGTQPSPLIREFPTGAWSDEARDYHVAVRVPIGPVGSERLAARVELVVTGEVVANGLVRGVWSTDTNLTTRIDPAVAHYTGQERLADVIQKGLQARADGDDRTATTLLGEAAKLAHEAGNEDTTRLLTKVVDVVDVEAGTVRLRQDVAKSDEMALDTRSTKTTRIKRTS
ncbi:MAG: VWA domain-containing protein [Actinomycetota bacterium]|nr:VWA domain-containing protein [Actinomycetota bacterium]